VLLLNSTNRASLATIQHFQNTIMSLIVEIQLAVVDEVYQCGGVFQVQFFKNVVAVHFHGFYRYVQGIGNFF
jgi:hypothetical protein